MTLTKTLKDITLTAAGEVEAIFSTYNVVDRDGDVLLPGSMTDGAPVFIGAWNHGSVTGPHPPVGYGTIHTTASDSRLRGKFLMNTEAGAAHFEAVKALAEIGIGEWSYSLLDVVSQLGTFAGQQARLISRVRVPEVSPVWQGASLNTRTLSAKDNAVIEEALRHVAAITAKQNAELRREHDKFLRFTAGER